MFFKKIGILFSLLLITAINSLSAETVTFNKSQFNIDAFSKQISCLRNDTTGSKYYHDFRVPVFSRCQSGLSTVPEQVSISNIVMHPVLSGINLKLITKNALKIYPEYSNQPVVITASGFSRDNGILNLEFSPFIFKSDTLFFVESFDYELSDYQNPFLTSGKAVDESELLIVGSKMFATDLIRYRIFKEQNGIKTEIVFVEDIVLATAGKNNAHRIRNYIKERYRLQRFKYLLLAGGTDIIPGVTFKKYADDYDAVVSDQFYSNFDKEFDSNNNGMYADYADNVDYYPELLTGRWPASTVAEIKPMVDKTIAYQCGSITTNPDYYRKILLMAFNLQNPGDTEKYCDSIIKYSESGQVPDRLYINSTPGISQSMVLSKLNQGANLVYAQAHGTANKFGISGGWGVFSDQVYNFTTPSGLYFIASCLPGDFSVYAMVVKALASPLGGSVNYIGVAGAEYPETSVPLHKLLAQQLATQKDLGTALDYARRVGFPDLSFGNNARSLYFGYNLCGDPSNYLFMQQPLELGLANLTPVKKGSSGITGEITGIISAPLKVTLWADNRILATSLTNTNQFELNYQNLFADSVTVAITAADVLFKKLTLPTIANNQELQVKDLRVIDANGSGIVESGERFKVGFSLKSWSNQPQADSLKILFKSASVTYSELYSDSVMLALPATGSEVNLQILDFQADFSTLVTDTTLSVSLQICPSASKNSKSLPTIYQQSLLIPIANPKLEISWVKFIGQNLISPVLLNHSAGKIDSAKIQLAEPDKQTNVLKTVFTLKNIPGRTLLFDSLSFYSDQNCAQRLYIEQNHGNSYQTSFFQKSTMNVSLSDTLNLKISNLGSNLFLQWSKYAETVGYNLFIYVNDTLQSTAPINKQLLLRPEYEFKLENYSAGDRVYARIGLVDNLNRHQFALSGLKIINLIPQYADAPFSLHPFQLFNPQLVNNKVVAVGEDGSLVSIPATGNGVNGNGVLFSSPAYGFENDYYQGKAFGDLNNDGIKEAVYLTYPGTRDSVYVRIINLQTGKQLAKLEVYGCCMYATPVLVNIDSDPELEILLSLFNGNNPDANTKGGYIYAFDYFDGVLQIKNGFPLISMASSYIVGAPIVADLNANGTNELLFSCGKNLLVYDLQSLTKLTEITFSNVIIGDPIVCDLNNDNKPEIICVEANKDVVDGKLVIFSFTTEHNLTPYGNLSGNNLVMQPYNFYKPGSAPVVADINHDSIPEIIVVTGKKLYVFNNDGSNFSCFPVDVPYSVSYNSASCPSLADFNGDGMLDILFIDRNANIYCYSGVSGLLLSGFPLNVPNSFHVQFGSISIADLDFDQDLEIMAGGKGGKLYIFDYPTKSSNRQIYSNYRADLANSGIFYPTDEPSGLEQNIPADFAILNQYPNPFNPVTTISFYLPKADDVQFKVYNTLGQMVFQQQKNYLSSGVKQIAFNGSDLSSGLYIYSISYGKQTLTGKCALLK